MDNEKNFKLTDSRLQTICLNVWNIVKKRGNAVTVIILLSYHEFGQYIQMPSDSFYRPEYT